MNATIAPDPEAAPPRPEFTSDWVTAHCGQWARHLAHLAGKPGARGLEVGVFEGRSALWWLEHILTGEGSCLTAIEPWRAKLEPNLHVFRSMGYRPGRLDVHWMRAQEALRRMGADPVFDFAYIDGGKDADNVLQVSVLAWLLLKPGGILIWDDYRWEWKEGVVSPFCEHPPKAGIDAFLAAHADRHEELHRGWQVIIKKL